VKGDQRSVFMKNGMTLATACFAAGMAGLGILGLRYGDFALQWQPVPKGVPWREGLAYASGAFLLAGSIGLLLRRSAAVAAMALTIYVLSWVLLLQTPRVAVDPKNIGAWLGFFENLAIAAGGWILFASRADQSLWRKLSFATGENGLRIGAFLFAISLPVFGLSHLMYADFTASMVPAWLPQRIGFAYFTGLAHIAAGIGLLIGILPRPAATLEAIMMSSFVCLVHIPGVAAEPGSRLQWTMLFVALALSGAAWAVATSLSGARQRSPGVRSNPVSWVGRS
jgi:uncharacterized membrane protein